MKTSTLFYIIAGILLLVVIIGYIIYLTAKKDKIGLIILKKAGYILVVLIFLEMIYSDQHRDYSLRHDQDTWTKYNLPQIDSLMHLHTTSPRWAYYKSSSTDSIIHSSKMILYDLFDIYSIEDDFINKEQDKLLTIKFVKPNIIRDSSRIITLSTKSDYKGILPIDTLTVSQCDSVLTDWGLRNGLYKKLIER